MCQVVELYRFYKGLVLTFGAFWREWHRNGGIETGFIRVSWMQFPVQMQPRKGWFHSTFYMCWRPPESRKVQHGMLIIPMLFNDFRCMFAKGASKPAINNMFYKGLVTAFFRFRRYMFPPWILRVFRIAKVCYRMLINVMVFQWFQCLFEGIGSRIINIPQVI